MRKLLSIAALLACTIHGYALADGIEPEMSSPDAMSDSRIRELMYNDADVYTITTKYGYQTNIVFGEGETIQTISVGDRSLWQIIPSGRRLFIRPMVDGASTNMTVLTNHHSYQFDLKSVAEDKGGNIYVARFVYPKDRPQSSYAPTYATPPRPVAAQPSYMPPAALPAAPSASPNYNYTYSGPDALAPQQVYDDGHSTYIRYRPGQKLPAVYAADAGDKNEQSVSYYVKDDLMVVDDVAPLLLLKSDDGTVKIYNEMLNPR